ncbi:retrotransposon ORF1 [Tanacetum coccineum]
MGDENPIRTLGDYSRPSHEGYKNTIELPEGNNAVPLRSDTIRRSIDQSVGGKLCDLNPNESWEILEDLALYDNESWNDPRDFAKPVKAIALPQVQRLMEAHIALTQPTQTITDRIAGTLPSDRVKNPKLGTHPVLSARSYSTMDPQCSTQFHGSVNTIIIHPKQPKESQVNGPEVDLEEDNFRDTNSNPYPQPNPFASITTKQVRKLNSMLESLGLIIRDDKPQNKDPHDVERATTEEPVVEYFDTLPTRNELTYHRYLMDGLIPSIFLRNPIITEGCPHNLKIPCNIRHMHIEKAYIDLNSPFNIMTRMMYNRVIRRKLNPREDANGGIRNFTGRIKGMLVFVGNFTYVVDFMIVEDISSIIDPRLSQVVLGRPFIEISNMTHDPSEGVVRFIRGTDEVAYKMPHKIEQYDSLSNLEKEHTKLVYLRNEEDKRRGVEHVMSKIL